MNRDEALQRLEQCADRLESGVTRIDALERQMGWAYVLIFMLAFAVLVSVVLVLQLPARLRDAPNPARPLDDGSVPSGPMLNPPSPPDVDRSRQWIVRASLCPPMPVNRASE